MRRCRWLFLLLPALLLVACANRPPPMVVERSLTGQSADTHTVVAGDTLYSIALRYDRDYRELARINGLGPDFLIRPGQRLRLSGPAVASNTANTVVSPPKAVAPAPAKVAKPAVDRPAPTENKTFVEKKPAPVPVVSPSVTAVPSASTSLAWGWPAKGVVLGDFGSSGVTGKGLDIAGKRGDSVSAAAAGTVVYAGAGLVGYGKLLIIRHDDNYISAYAHNDQFLVKEGERVKLGQAIAEMGASGTDRDKLHFEIRERGKPVDPMRFLPAR